MAGGGAERQLAYLADELGRIGWQVHVAVMRRGPNWDRLVASGAAIHELPANTAYDARLVGRLRRVIARTAPHIVQAWLLQMEVMGGLAAFTSGKPWLLTERASKDAYPSTPKSFFRRAVAQLATAVVSNSAAGDEYWRQRVRNRVRRYIIPNGLPLGEIAAAPAEPASALGIETHEPMVLFAGRLVPQKNIEVVLSALRLLLSRRHVRVFCCGEGPLRGRIEQWIAAEGVGNRVTMMGYVPNLWSVMKRATLLVSPSLFEGSPNVVLEAMACGVPLVVSDISEHRELLDDCSALLVDPHSADRLADAIETVLKDPAGAAARAVVAKRRVERYGLHTIACQYNDVYLEMLSMKGNAN